METTGACFCGRIEYRAEIDPDRIGICHCRDCQIQGGGAFRVAALVAPADFVITQGSPRSYPKTADSGRVRDQLFCGDCGTGLASMPEDPTAPGAYAAVRVITSKDFESLAPRFEVWCAARLSWLPVVDGTVRLDRQT